MYALLEALDSGRKTALSTFTLTGCKRRCEGWREVLWRQDSDSLPSKCKESWGEPSHVGFSTQELLRRTKLSYQNQSSHQTRWRRWPFSSCTTWVWSVAKKPWAVRAVPESRKPYWSGSATQAFHLTTLTIISRGCRGSWSWSAAWRGIWRRTFLLASHSCSFGQMKKTRRQKLCLPCWERTIFLASRME